jgi:hypothetical protein
VLGRCVDVNVERSASYESFAVTRHPRARIDERDHGEGHREDEEQIDQQVATGDGAGCIVRAQSGKPPYRLSLLSINDSIDIRYSQCASVDPAARLIGSDAGISPAADGRHRR